MEDLTTHKPSSAPSFGLSLLDNNLLCSSLESFASLCREAEPSHQPWDAQQLLKGMEAVPSSGGAKKALLLYFSCLAQQCGCLGLLGQLSSVGDSLSWYWQQGPREGCLLLP